MNKIKFAVIILLIGGMIMSYTRVNWQNAPSTATPVNAENLNTMDKGIADAHSQLAEKADENEVIGRINLKRDKSAPITLNDIDSEMLAAIEGGEGTAFNLESIPRDMSVTPKKTTFVKMGINKFDGDYRYNSTLLTDGTLSSNNTTSTVAVVPISGGKTYYCSWSGGNRKRIGFHKTKPIFEGETIDYYIGDSGGGWTYGESVQAPEDANYLVILVNTEPMNIDLQVTEGADYPYFIGYDVNIQLEAKSLNIGVLEECERLNNVLKVNRAFLYSGELHVQIDYSERTITIPSGVRALYAGKRHVIENEGTPISFEGVAQSFILFFKPSDRTVGITPIAINGETPDDIAVIGIINPLKPLFYGMDEYLIEVNGEMFIPSQIKDYVKNELEQSEATQEKFYFLDSIEGIYKRPDGLESVATGESLVLSVSPYTIIYNIYDQLIADYPDYVTKKLLGSDTARYPIYQYAFKPLEINNESNYSSRKLKIAINAGIHGYEQMSSWATAQFFKDLCENWEQKSPLEFMRWNVEFAVVPVANPWGFSNNTRENMNGIDLNRNFPPYSNGSEIETQILMSFLEQNSDAQFLIDFHNISGGYPMTYSASEDATTIMTNLWRGLTRKWRTDYPLAPQNVAFGYIKQNGISGRFATYGMELGMIPITLETPWMMPFAEKQYDKITAEVAVDSLGNLLTIICKSYL